jgi:hypothetical protein
MVRLAGDPGEHLGEARGLGRAVPVDPIKPILKAPGSILLKLRCNGSLSNLAFKFNLRRHNLGWQRVKHDDTEL